VNISYEVLYEEILLKQNENKTLALKFLGANFWLMYSEMFVVFGVFCIPGCWIKYPIPVL
jgi:hypothetical protein